ncbi:hypothetical protein E2C01_075591 [Portunus trituberculatus]|uniref:Uncharacterized protein n=1 Tax=Portunus trituberculatus TaxID=210409 RepID=A0A5B7I6H2_PORTR|nr:hypothetical protein [Portunus trituberculatus]
MVSVCVGFSCWCRGASTIRTPPASPLHSHSASPHPCSSSPSFIHSVPYFQSLVAPQPHTIREARLALSSSQPCSLFLTWLSRPVL